MPGNSRVRALALWRATSPRMRRPPSAARRFESSEMFRCGITLARADSFEFFGRDIDLKAPARHVRTLPWQDRIERKIGRGEGLPQPRQFVFGRDRVQLEKVTEAAYDCSDAQTQGVVHKLGRLHVRVSHPETFCHFGNASAILGLPESVNHGPLQVAEVHKFLFGYPVFCRTEEKVRLDQNETI